MGGYLAYLLHLYAGYFLYFDGWNATLAHQGWVTLIANLSLLAIWTASSALAAWRIPAFWLHAAAMATLMVLAVMSTYHRDTWALYLGYALLAIWVVVGLVRIARRSP